MSESKYITEILDADGTVIGKVTTEWQLSAEEIAELTENARNRKRKLNEPGTQEVTPPPEPTGEDVSMTIEDELHARRMGRAAKKIHREDGISLFSQETADIFDPDFDLSQLSDDELMRGQRRATDGSWRGRKPKALPADYHRRAMKELFRRADEALQIHLPAASKAMARIATDDEMDPKDQMKAAMWLIERVAGKTPERVEIARADPWADAIEGVAVDAEETAIARARGVLDNEESNG